MTFLGETKKSREIAREIFLYKEGGNIGLPLE